MKKIILILKKNLLIYILWTISAILIALWGFSLLTKVPEKRKIDMLIHANNINEDALKTFIENNKEEYLMQINYRVIDKSNESLLNETMKSYGDSEADFYILTNNDLETNDFDHYFYKLNEETCKCELGEGLEFYKDDSGVIYGIHINISFLTDTEDVYYIMFANDSIHLGEFTDSKYSGVITLCKALLQGN